MQKPLKLDSLDATLQVPLEPTAAEVDAKLAGFRLQRFEVLNWGTFHERPWVLPIDGGTALLTGANGSGKSTLVDAMLTLLVPNMRRNYNQASSEAGKKKERNEKSYVQGAYGRVRAEDSYGSKTKLLREKNSLSVLLAYFYDEVLEQSVTLAQVLWIEGSHSTVHKFFAIAPFPLSIETHFSDISRVADLKQRLQNNGVELFDRFSHYAQSFRKQLGLQSEKALDLFNQTVSIKQIGGLNDFVRNHMLEKADVQTKIQELQESYENLTISHTAIKKARKQLEALEPLTKAAKKYGKLGNEVATLAGFLVVAPIFFAGKKLALLKAELKIIEEKLTQAQHQKAESDRLLNTLRTEAKDLEFAIKQDSVGQRIQELTASIERVGKTVEAKKQQSETYGQLVKKLGLDKDEKGKTVGETRRSFETAREQGEALQQEIEAALQTLETQRDEQKVRQSELQKAKAELDNELTSLRSRKSQIPKQNLDIRDRLTEALKLESSDLPFVGELLQVRREEKAWEGAIERLLRGFGLCLLVPQAHYRTVNAYVNKTHLRGRLVYYRVKAAEPNPVQRGSEPGRVAHKLRIKPEEETFAGWLRDRLSQQFNYVCTDSIAQFQREVKAITQDGLIKHSGERHEKDDRSRIGDRTRYILGWDNADKIKALEKEQQQIGERLLVAEQQIRTIERQQLKERRKEEALRDFMKISDFSEIDWRQAERDRLDLEKQRKELEATSDKLKQLKQQLQSTEKEIDRAEEQRDKSLRACQTLEDSQRKNEREQRQCEEKLNQDKKADTAAVEKGMEAALKKCALTLETIAQDESDIKETIQDQLSQKRDQLSTAQSKIEKAMLNFNNEFPDSTLELSASLDYLDEYLALREQIKKDDLPRHEKRFKDLMNEKIVTAILMFKTDLERQEAEFRAAIDMLNESLVKIDYTDSTYIELRYDTARNVEILGFKEDLKVCLGDVALQAAEDHEARFQDIQTRLIEKFKGSDRWTKLVTDVRNWLDFSVSERYRADDEEKEHHTDSSGKSGGQKVKLAYTILASAIAYQFGLHRESGTDSPAYESSRQKSFRFVVIDEAFSKSDDSNARYAMELFKNLQLQLLVITPKDKINVVEPYLSSIHLVSNTPEGDYSRVDPISIEQYRHERQLALDAQS